MPRGTLNARGAHHFFMQCNHRSPGIGCGVNAARDALDFHLQLSLRLSHVGLTATISPCRSVHRPPPPKNPIAALHQRLIFGPRQASFLTTRRDRPVDLSQCCLELTTPKDQSRDQGHPLDPPRSLDLCTCDTRCDRRCFSAVPTAWSPRCSSICAAQSLADPDPEPK